MRWGPIHLNEDDGEEGSGRVQKLLNYFNYERLSDRSKAMARSGIICFLIFVSILFISLGTWKLFGHAGGHHHHPCHDSPSHEPSEVTHLDPAYFRDLGSKRVKIRYGPYIAPSIHDNGGMEGFGAMDILKPCSDCTITWIQAGLEYPHGSNANIDTGMWLHHTLLLNRDKEDATCGKLPHAERMFASGNERTPVDLCLGGAIKRGYYIGANDNFDLSTELMNENEAPSEVYVVITYEYLPGLPHDFHATKQIWLDVGGCTGSGQPAKPHSSFELTMERPWISPFSGHVTYIGGHVHDGGTHVEVLKNDVVVCDCVATYGGDPEFVEGDHGMGMQHISRISTCEGNFPVEKGDRWSIMAYYNTSEHMPMGDGQGGLEPVMGIAMVYAVEDQ
ncbi:MAG: hypothetical protein M1824_006514 [Vezdaea acicularis]|nr:MAG: hypothetical protein M1824_006514 [Vezdaea acicularis]